MNTATRAHLYRIALDAAIGGDEGVLTLVLVDLGDADLARLGNALTDLKDKIDARRKILWRDR